MDAGWREVSTLGPLPVVCSRQGTLHKICGVAADDAQLSPADLIRTYDTRWAIAPWVKDLKQLRGLRPVPEPLVLGGRDTPASGLLGLCPLAPPRIERDGAQG